ncbi:hypothetical protein J6590_046304 [Homalodisca vitripennis]|nr:hypothetical protein J6590_046304 [Homalodisca vitripennis]
MMGQYITQEWIQIQFFQPLELLASLTLSQLFDFELRKVLDTLCKHTGRGHVAGVKVTGVDGMYGCTARRQSTYKTLALATGDYFCHYLIEP